MSLVLSVKGELALLRNAVYSTGTPPRNWKLRLYTNSHAILRADATAAFTEATFLGYANAAIAGWANPTTVSSKGQSTATPIVYTASLSIITPQVVYGYYVTDTDDSDTWLWGEIFVDPITMSYPGQTLTVTPLLTSTS